MPQENRQMLVGAYQFFDGGVGRCVVCILVLLDGLAFSREICDAELLSKDLALLMCFWAGPLIPSKRQKMLGMSVDVRGEHKRRYAHNIM